MATLEECREALHALRARLSENATDVRKHLNLDRPIACHLTDLGLTFHGRLVDGQVVGLTEGDDPDAKIRLTTNSDDLIALVGGELDVPSAWAGGRLKIDASVFDLLKLRKLL